jgi:UDP-N-acetylglucosamine--N-acetylmuramyl-(pentapeptide) pyrophosphoryl-undecaprenol N-acetylglucosamine transferase
MSDPLRIILAAGGTGGHVFPAIAIADALSEARPGAQFLFVGTRDRMEWKAVPAAGYDIAPIWISGFHRRLTLKNLLFPLKLLVSLWQSRRLVRRFAPHAAISCGGFASGPVGWMAARRGVPLFLQEQNSFPGVTTRKLAPKARLIFTAFDEAAKWLPKEKIVVAGNPVRGELIRKLQDPAFPAHAREHFGLDAARPVLLVMGGSGGARSINQAMLRHIGAFLEDGVQVIWQCGEVYLDAIRKELGLHETGVDAGRYSDLRLFGFMNDITEAWAAADLIVSRAGAITCSELLATGKAGILVPSPHVAGDHQMHNARSLADKGAALLLADADLAEKLTETVRSLLGDASRRKLMEQQARAMAKKDAAADIARRILEQIDRGATPTSNRNFQNSTTTA